MDRHEWGGGGDLGQRIIYQFLYLNGRAEIGVRICVCVLVCVCDYYHIMCECRRACVYVCGYAPVCAVEGRTMSNDCANRVRACMWVDVCSCVRLSVRFSFSGSSSSVRACVRM